MAKTKFVDEFRDFITKGNVMDMAVGVIIGGAFQGIISSLVDDIIMPLISAITGGIDFSNWFISLDGNHYATLSAAQEAGAATLGYGKFITVVINFLLMALVIFCMIKGIENLKKSVIKKNEQDEAADPTEKECPFCKSMIPIGATRCGHCTSQL